ncbi:family 78 glycoside hydrolase catalytic domain [Paenibacillus daejeonensis]|uniref:family 78 glycoside hydrolase catalytic domain n=1 Tax=Paenibacillus daejeonensis TaxID=135193 RepID=UPI00035E3BC7|nr:family 78 glycoside hydrolase catalytic domain [Paenibacillus daejeonensis]
MNNKDQISWIGDPVFATYRKQDIRHKEMHSAPGTEHHPDELLNHHLLLRKCFEYGNASPARATFSISADDYCKVYINGRYVAEGPAQGYPDRYYYQNIDVGSYLQPGPNVIAVHLYYHGKISRSYTSGDFRHGLWASLEADGETLLVSDTSWRIKKAQEYVAKTTLGYDTQYHEHIDNRLKDEDWRELDFDDSQWAYAVVQPDMEDMRLIVQPTPPVQLTTLYPAEIREIGEDRLWIDFGKEITGAIQMKATGQAGQVVEIGCGEELLDNGRVRYAMRCNCDYRDEWTLSGADPDVLEWFDYKAFRYAEITTPPRARIDKESIVAIVRHYPVDEANGQLQSDSRLLEDIWRICRQAVVYGTQDYYTDCPSREKGGYLGDNTIIAQSHVYVSGDLRLFRKTLEDFAATTSICPGMMAVTSGSLMQEIADYSLQWPMQVLMYYKHSGDKAFVQQMLPYAQGLIAHFAAFAGDDGLLHQVDDKWNLVDWPVGFLDGYDFPLTKPVGPGCHNVINAFYRDALNSTNELKKIAGEEGPLYDVAAFDAAFHSAFWNGETGLFRDAVGSTHHSLHANMLPLAFQMVPEQNQASVVAFLKEKRLSCGVYMAYFYLRALAAAGEYTAIWETILSQEEHEYPSSDPNHSGTGTVTSGYWANMVKEGATTCFEAWSKELKWNTSLCHPWASSPIPIIVEEILGIQPAEPGWSSILLRPNLPPHMPDLELSLPLPCGRVVVKVNHGEVSLH